MSGFVILAGVAIAALALLWASGLRGSWLTLAAAALLFGGAGYTLHGRPDLIGSPESTRSPRPVMPLTNARHAFFGQFISSERWLILADSYGRRGDTEQAVGAVKAGLKANPDDFILWIGLGNTLTDHARTLTPAGDLAFNRAKLLAPWSPGPGFFLGLAKLRSGDAEGALAEWRAILAAAPAEASWRPIVEDGVAAIERGAGPAPVQAGS